MSIAIISNKFDCGPVRDSEMKSLSPAPDFTVLLKSLVPHPHARLASTTAFHHSPSPSTGHHSLIIYHPPVVRIHHQGIFPCRTGRRSPSKQFPAFREKRTVTGRGHQAEAAKGRGTWWHGSCSFRHSEHDICSGVAKPIINHQVIIII